MKLLPTDEKFFDLFVDQARLLAEAADALCSGGSVSEVEKRADQKLSEILAKLNNTFITPLDPEDVGLIANGMENLIDSLEALEFRLEACIAGELSFKVDGALRKLADVSHDITRVFEQLQRDQIRKKEELLQSCNDVRGKLTLIIAETREQLRLSYRNEKDPICLIKSRDVCEWTETVARGFQLFMEAVQNIITKNS